MGSVEGEAEESGLDNWKQHIAQRPAQAD